MKCSFAFSAALATCALGLLGLGDPSAVLAEGGAQPQAAPCPRGTIQPFEGDGNALQGYSGEVRLIANACMPSRLIVYSQENTFGHSSMPQFAPGPSGYTSGVRFQTCRVVQEDRPGAWLEMRLEGGPESRNLGGAVLTLAPDEEPPKITEISPPSGTKLRPGQRITVKVTASEAYADGNRGWQGGIKSIRVQDLTGHSDLAPWTNDSARPQACGAKTWTKTHEMDFRVPDPTPRSVVRLRVTVRDYANNPTTQDVEYPTQGDWYGTFNMTTFSAGQDRFRVRADIVLNHDGRGNLTGTMVGQQEYVAHSTPNCSFRQVQPNRFRVSLVGSLTERSSPAEGSTLKVFIGEIEETALRAEARCGGGGGGPVGPPGGWKFKTSVFPPEVLLGTPGPLGDGQVLADGTREYKLESAAGGAGTRWAVTLRRARN